MGTADGLLQRRNRWRLSSDSARRCIIINTCSKYNQVLTWIHNLSYIAKYLSELCYNFLDRSYTNEKPPFLVALQKCSELCYIHIIAHHMYRTNTYLTDVLYDHIYKKDVTVEYKATVGAMTLGLSTPDLPCTQQPSSIGWRVKIWLLVNSRDIEPPYGQSQKSIDKYKYLCYYV